MNQQNDMRYWPEFFRAPRLSIVPRKLLRPGASIFTMGSCFALEVRKSLSMRGYKSYPDYALVKIDADHEVFDKIPAREMPAHYDTFTMRQEFEAALGKWADRDAGYWAISNTKANELFEENEIHQDPYRKSTFARSRERLVGLSDRITAAVRDGLDKATIVVLTLGLTEVWRHNQTGKHICRPPGTGLGGGTGLATFKQSRFNENYENVRAMLDLLFARYPEKHVILSVSPVRLERTYSQMDIGTANLESKSILRAVAGQIAAEYPERVTYFPSYEMAMAGLGSITGLGNVFEKDGRHVREDFVSSVIKSFISAIS